MLRSLLFALAAITATFQAAPADSATRLTASLLAESNTPAAGRTVRLALKFEPRDGWHGYWSNPGDSGLPPKVSWEAPKGVSFGPLRHPAPSFLDVAGLASFVHAGSHVLLTDMRVPATLPAGSELPLKARLEWLTCSDKFCVPERATLELKLEVGDGRPAAANAALFRSAAAALPRPVRAQGSFTASDGQLVLGLPDGVSVNPAAVRFYPEKRGVLSGRKQQARAKPGATEIRIEASGDPGAELAGIVSDGRRSYRVRFARSVAPARPPGVPEELAAPATAADQPASPAAAQPQTPSAPSSLEAARVDAPGPPFLAALLGALAGGLLLNLMPCVFPVLSLKALHLARSGVSASTARRESLAYLGGTMAVTTALGAVLLALRGLGMEVGWSFQLQNPYVIFALMLMVTAIAANLLGLFEVPGPSFDGAPSGSGTRASFATGALSAFIATPCSAPFMASALGAALFLPPGASLAIFAGLGLGLALPFVMIAFVPALRTRLPKPGAWMNRLRRILALPMIATAIALLWVLGRQLGSDGVIAGGVIIAFLLAALWWLGAQQRVNRGGGWVPLVPVAVAGAIALLLVPVQPRQAVEASSTRLEEPFSQQRLAELTLARVPVFVDFTADWCLTCKVNERLAIDREETGAAFERAGIVTLEGDWTNGDPAITRFLAAHGRNSIPYYLFYAPGREPEVLPQLLTPATLKGLSAQVEARTPRGEASGS